VEQAYPYDDDQKQREEHAYELAEYLRAHPSPNHSLRQRAAVLSQASEAELDRLLPEIQYWLDLFEWQDEANS